MLRKSQSNPGRRARRSLAAFTLLENVIACSIVAIGLACTYTINGQCMTVLRMAKDQAAASQVLQQRIEHLRIANWARITSPVWIKNSMLNVSADGSDKLTALKETITIAPLNSTTANAAQVNSFGRTGTTATSSGQNINLVAENLVTVKWTVEWNGIPSGKKHTRETMTVLGKGGVAK